MKTLKQSKAVKVTRSHVEVTLYGQTVRATRKQADRWAAENELLAGFPGAAAEHFFFWLQN